jgi:hypothetical protein
MVRRITPLDILVVPDVKSRMDMDVMSRSALTKALFPFSRSAFSLFFKLSKVINLTII